MAIPFCEPTEEQTPNNLHHLHHHYQPQQSLNNEEVDQVDGHVMSNPPNIVNIETPPNSPPPPVGSDEDALAWKLLALAMCKALKDHYQQNMAASTSSGGHTSSTAVIEILPNGQMKPSWN